VNGKEKNAQGLHRMLKCGIFVFLLFLDQASSFQTTPAFHLPVAGRVWKVRGCWGSMNLEWSPSGTGGMQGAIVTKSGKQIDGVIHISSYLHSQISTRRNAHIIYTYIRAHAQAGPNQYDVDVDGAMCKNGKLGKVNVKVRYYLIDCFIFHVANKM